MAGQAAQARLESLRGLPVPVKVMRVVFKSHSIYSCHRVAPARHLYSRRRLQASSCCLVAFLHVCVLTAPPEPLLSLLSCS